MFFKLTNIPNLYKNKPSNKQKTKKKLLHQFYTKQVKSI